MITQSLTSIALPSSRNGNGHHNASDLVADTVKDRGKFYGDPHDSHENIGLSWTGLIQQHYGIKLPHPLPAHVVEQMMVVFKMHRATKAFHQDNYVDAHAYCGFAEESQRKFYGGTYTAKESAEATLRDRSAEP